MAHGWFDCDDLDAVCVPGCATAASASLSIRSPPPWRAGGRWAQISGPGGALFGLIEQG
jgi:hypothetical protein